MYNLAIFTSSFLYPSIGVGAVVTGIVVGGVISYKSKDGRLKGGVC